MIEVMPLFRAFQGCIEGQRLTGGMVILQYQSRESARCFLAASQAAAIRPDGSPGGVILTLPEDRVAASRDLAGVVSSTLIEEGHFSLTRRGQCPRREAVRQLQGADVRLVNLQRHRNVTARFLLDIVSLIETAREIGHCMVFVLATSQSYRDLVHREPAVRSEASVIHIGPVTRVEMIGLLHHHKYKGTGVAALARLSNGEWGVIWKILATIQARRGTREKEISREEVEEAVEDLRLAGIARDPELVTA